MKCHICGTEFTLIDLRDDGSPEGAAAVQEGLAIQMREVLDHECVCQTCERPVERDAAHAVGSANGECPHPKDARVDLASMGAISTEFFCKMCGETVRA